MSAVRNSFAFAPRARQTKLPFRGRLGTGLVIVFAVGISAASTGANPAATPAPSAEKPARAASQPPGIPRAGSDRQWIGALLAHDERVLEVARLAERKAHPTVKAFAGGIAARKQQDIARLKAWREAWNGTGEGHAAPQDPAPGRWPGADWATLNTATGAHFDAAFLDTMMRAHHAEIALSKEVQANAQRAELKDFARQLVVVDRQEIARMNQWQQTPVGGHDMLHE